MKAKTSIKKRATILLAANGSPPSGTGGTALAEPMTGSLKALLGYLNERRCTAAGDEPLEKLHRYYDTSNVSTHDYKLFADVVDNEVSNEEIQPGWSPLPRSGSLASEETSDTGGAVRIRGKHTAFLVLVAMLAIPAAGCGAEQDGKDADRARSKPRPKIALGTISAVEAEERRLYLRPTMGEKVMRFRVVEGAGITLDGHSAALASLKEGQQAKVEYVVVDDANRANALEVFGG